MKDTVKKIIAVTALLLGVILILSGGLGYLLISHEPQTTHIISENQKEFLKDKEKRQEKIENAEYGGEVTHVEGAAISEARLNYNSSVEEYGIGSVYIPSSNISIPLLAGTSEWNLLNGVATASANQKLGEGLFIGLSHNLVNERLLQNIDQAEKNDLVYLTDFTNVYIYKISEQKVVHETESYYLQEPNEGEDAKLLLYRCEGELNTDWRRIIYGDYIKKEKIKDVDEKILAGLMIDVEGIKEESPEIDSSKTYNKQNQRNNKKESKNIFQIIVSKIIDWISKSDALTTFSLRIYGLADSYTLFFFLFILLLFIIYYLI